VDNQTTQKPKHKKKGPIRWEAIVPFTVIVAAIVVYFMLFFDLHMKKSLEWVGTRVNGAEVNIGSFKTSFWGGSLTIQDIQVTDPAEPSRNRVQIGKVYFDFLWDALLRAKFVVKNSLINDLQAQSPRKSPGLVLPPEPEKEEKDSWMSSMQTTALKKAKEKLSASSLGDAAKILEGFDPTKQLKDLGQLKSAAYIEQLKTQLTQKQAEWNQTLNTLPSSADLNQLQAKVTGIKVGGATNPGEITAQVNQVTGVVSETQQKVETVKTKGDALGKDVSQFNQSVQSIDEMIKKDKEELESKLKLPKLDAKNLADQLFGDTVLNRVAEVQKYIALARKYMPEKKAAKPKEEKAPRGVGKTYVFGSPNSYPRFWLKKAEVTSKAENSPFGGDATGQLIDFSSDQPLTGKPAIANFQANFPKPSIYQVSGKIVMDHTGDVATEKLEAKVGSFPVEGRKLSDSDSLKFGMAKATGSADLSGVLKGNSVSFNIGSSFQKIDYQIAAQSKILESTLKEVVRDIPVVSVQAQVSGTWDSLGVSIQSNLASALQKGFEKQLQSRLADARKRLDEMVNAQVAAKRKEVTDQYNAAKGQITAQIDEKRKKAEEVQNLAQAKLNEAKNQTSAVQNKAKDAIKGRFKF
jgi:uncharacterized protein (TIGR03545 family)